MKKTLLTLLTGLFLSLAALAQNYTVTVYGTVSMVTGNSITPVPNQAIIITIDSSNTGFYYQNTVLTDETGYYEDIVEIPGFSGYEMVHTMTLDSCLGQYLYNVQAIIPGATLIPMDFLLCNTITPDCQAMFLYYQQDPVDPYTYSFMNVSTGSYTELTWSFGDSTYSNESNPIHTFPAEGTYYVCLTISDGTFCNNTYCETVYVGGGGWTGCENYFLYYNADNEPYTLNFEGYLYNGQEAFYYSWDFGDGTTGSGQSVTHTYSPQGAGMYMVGLTTMSLDSSGMDSCVYTTFQEVWLDSVPPGDCESFILPINMYGLTVDFQGYTISPFETSFTWEFGDGVTATGEFISHTYSAPGMYTVYLYTIDATGCAFETFTQVWVDDNSTGCSNYFIYEQSDSTTYTFTGMVYLNNGGTFPDSTSTYSWDFGDGTTGTGQTITHYFQENPAGYNVCLTTTTVLPDGSLCTAVYCEYIPTVMPSFNIYGFVYLSNNTPADQAVVHLMTMDTLWQGVIEVQSTTIDSGGYYDFTGLQMDYGRMYFVQAELTEGSAYFGDYLPTYHLNSLSWEQAMPILPLENWPADVLMIPGSPVDGGNGIISGIVTNLGSRGFMNDVEVVLMDGQGNPLMYMRSDNEGYFEFINLPYGTYIVHAEIMGIHTVQTGITLNEENPVSSVEVQVSGGEANLVFGLPEQRISLDEVGDIFPNPVSETARIEINAKKAVELQISIISQTGQLMDVNALSLPEGAHYYDLETRTLPAGLYLLRITTGQGETVSRKFLKMQ
jgi:PKD repeat protein